MSKTIKNQPKKTPALPWRFKLDPTPGGDSMKLTDTFTGITTAVPLYAWSAVSEALDALFPNPEIGMSLEKNWAYSPELGMFDVFITVEGYPKYSGLRVYLTPESGIRMEWSHEGEQFENDKAPIPEQIRRQALELVMGDLAKRLD